jgi:hypothetical protein
MLPCSSTSGAVAALCINALTLSSDLDIYLCFKLLYAHHLRVTSYFFSPLQAMEIAHRTTTFASLTVAPASEHRCLTTWRLSIHRYTQPDSRFYPTARAIFDVSHVNSSTTLMPNASPPPPSTYNLTFGLDPQLSSSVKTKCQVKSCDSY